MDAYASEDFQHQLEARFIKGLMCRKYDYWDKPPTETVFGSTDTLPGLGRAKHEGAGRADLIQQ